MAVKSANPKPHRRVEAWIYTAINPVIEALRDEAAALREGYLGWRGGPGYALVVRPIRERLAYQHLPNLDDLLDERPELEAQLARHDELAVRLGRLAASRHRQMLGNDGFRARANAAFALVSPGVRAPESLLGAIADLLINHGGDLDAHAEMRELVARDPALLPDLAPYAKDAELDGAARELAKFAEDLGQRFRELRRRLCREYDLPAAPVTRSDGA